MGTNTTAAPSLFKAALSQLPVATAAPKKPAGGVHAAMRPKLLPAILELVLNRDEPITTEEIGQLVGATSYNVGMGTGSGVGNRAGLGLWKNKAGDVIPCYQNAKFVLERMSEADIAAFCAAQGLTAEGLIEAVTKLRVAVE